MEPVASRMQRTTKLYDDSLKPKHCVCCSEIESFFCVCANPTALRELGGVQDRDESYGMKSYHVAFTNNCTMDVGKLASNNVSPTVSSLAAKHQFEL